MKDKLKVPKLRFKEFSGEWEEKELGEIVISYKLGGNYKNTLNKTDYPLIKMGNIGRGKINLDKIEYIEENELIDENDVIKYGDLFFNTRNTLDLVGKVSIWRNELDKAYYNSNLLRLKFHNNFFMNYLLNNDMTLSKLKAFATGTTSVAAIYTRDLLVLELDIPSLPEQQKIADFLSKVDEKIEKLTKKKELLEQYKKGVMQKIFSQELRFKDDNGNDFPEWEEKELGEVLIKNSIKNKNQEFQLVQSVSNKYGFVNQDEYFEDRTVASKDLSNYYVIKKGMFAYNPSRIDVGSLAYKYDNEISVISPLYISFEANNSFIADNYLLNWFGTIQFKNQMNRSFEGSVRNTLSYEALRKILIEFPSLPEQQKIADFLSTLDKKIDIVDKELGQVQEFKKGLLQQMFV